MSLLASAKILIDGFPIVALAIAFHIVACVIRTMAMVLNAKLRNISKLPALRYEVEYNTESRTDGWIDGSIGV